MSSHGTPSAADESAPAGLRAAAHLALAAGAVVSVGMMIRAGLRQHSSVFLIVLIAGWVVAPYAGLGLANVLATRWSVPARTTLAVATLVIALGSPALYVLDAFDPLSAKAAAVYVMVPGIAWLFIAIVVLVGALVLRGARR